MTPATIFFSDFRWAWRSFTSLLEAGRVEWMRKSASSTVVNVAAIRVAAAFAHSRFASRAPAAGGRDVTAGSVVPASGWGFFSAAGSGVGVAAGAASGSAGLAATAGGSATGGAAASGAGEGAALEAGAGAAAVDDGGAGFRSDGDIASGACPGRRQPVPYLLYPSAARAFSQSSS